MKIASMKNEKPSIAKPSPKTLPKVAVKFGHSRPISKLRIVPVITPTANRATITRVQRRECNRIRRPGGPHVAITAASRVCAISARPEQAHEARRLAAGAGDRDAGLRRRDAVLEGTGERGRFARERGDRGRLHAADD